MSIITSNTIQEQVKADDLKKIQAALQALKETEELESDLLSFGLVGIDYHVANIESDWLERWGEGCENLD
jgi:hypothetical protein